MARTRKAPPPKTLVAKVFLKAGRRSRRKLEDTREFTATDFTRAWRSMRCWAWRKGYEIITEKNEARDAYVVELIIGAEYAA